MALVFDKTIMEALGIQSDTPLQLTLSGNTLMVVPANTGVDESTLSEEMEHLLPRYETMLNNLAK